MRRLGCEIWLVLLCCILVGCGFKTNPRPAASTVPGEIGLVDAEAFPDRVVLKWEAPLSNTDGSLLKDVSGFKVFRSTQKIGEQCEDCPDHKTVYANVDFQNPVSAVVRGREVTYVDIGVTPGNAYAYAVTTYNFKGREGGPSPDVTVTLDDFPPPPDGLKGVSDGAEVVLEWTPPPRPAGIRSYRIYRAQSDKPEEMKPIGGTKWAETQFHDKSVEKNKIYYYVVRSLKMNRGIPFESQPSETVRVEAALPRTQPPENVKTKTDRSGISVSWDTVRLPDNSARYNVYRSESGKRFVKVNTEPLTNTPFVDKDVTAGKFYRYAVTCFQHGKPEDESSRTASEAVQFKR